MTLPSTSEFLCPECGRDCRTQLALNACCQDEDDDDIGFVAYWRSHN